VFNCLPIGKCLLAVNWHNPLCFIGYLKEQDVVAAWFARPIVTSLAFLAAFPGNPGTILSGVFIYANIMPSCDVLIYQ